MFDVSRRPSSNLGISTFEEMDKLFDNFFRSTGLPTSAFNLPSVDIYSEDNNHMVVEMPAPGFDDQDIEINIRDGLLEIKGQKVERDEKKKSGRNYIVRESNANFARRVVLPEGADADNISADLDKGLLKITVPVHRPQAKRIQIRSSKHVEGKKIAA
ncbi:MAG: Hsp20/alpha crystallin family protein [Candidatus Saccharimonadales bacterium]